MAHTEYQAHEVCIEIYVEPLLATVYKMLIASTKYRAHEACIEVARTTTVYKVGVT